MSKFEQDLNKRAHEHQDWMCSERKSGWLKIKFNRGSVEKVFADLELN